MNLSNIALLLTAGLLAFTAYLSLQSRKSTSDRIDEIESRILENNAEAEKVKAAEAARMEAELEIERERNEELAKRNADLAAETARMAAEKEALENEVEVVVGGAQAAIDAAGGENEPVDLTPQQQKIKEAASIASVTDFQEEYGFVVLNRGTNSGLVPGMKFAIRRDYYIVGRIELDSVKEDEAIGNVVASSIPVGFAIKKGDAVIMAEDAGIF